MSAVSVDSVGDVSVSVSSVGASDSVGLSSSVGSICEVRGSIESVGEVWGSIDSVAIDAVRSAGDGVSGGKSRSICSGVIQGSVDVAAVGVGSTGWNWPPPLRRCWRR